MKITRKKAKFDRNCAMEGCPIPIFKNDNCYCLGNGDELKEICSFCLEELLKKQDGQMIFSQSNTECLCCADTIKKGEGCFTSINSIDFLICFICGVRIFDLTIEDLAESQLADKVS
jgi:hypothetical protein